MNVSSVRVCMGMRLKVVQVSVLCIETSARKTED